MTLKNKILLSLYENINPLTSMKLCEIHNCNPSTMSGKINYLLKKGKIKIDGFEKSLKSNRAYISYSLNCGIEEINEGINKDINKDICTLSKKEKAYLAHKKWYENNKEKALEHNRKWRNKNKGYYSEYMRKKKLKEKQ